MACHVASGPLSHACLCSDVHFTCDKDEEHSMCQNPIRVIFNIIVLLITTVIPLSGLASCLGLFLCMSVIRTCAVLNYSETLLTMGSHSY